MPQVISDDLITITQNNTKTGLVEQSKYAPLNHVNTICNVVYYVDSICGAGKTTALIQYAYDKAKKGGKIVIAQPTKKLCLETYNNIKQKYNTDSSIKKYNVDYEIINKDEIDTTKTPAKEIIATMTAHNNKAKGHILIITHAALGIVANKKNKKYCKNYDLFVDEVISATSSYYFDHLETGIIRKSNTKNYIGNYAHVSLVKASKQNNIPGNQSINRLVKNNKQFTKYQPLISNLQNNCIDVLCDNNEYKNATTRVDGKLVNPITFYTILKPDIVSDFKSATVLAANLKHDLLI